MPYPVMNTMLDAGFPKGALNYWLSSFTLGLTDALIDTVVERYAAVPSPMTPMMFEHFHGAVTRVGADGHRRPASRAGLEPADPVGVDRPRRHGGEHRLDARRRTPRCKPELSERRWLNYLGDDQGDDAIRAAYGPNYDRLRELKRRYDPENVFHLNHNIAP